MTELQVTWFILVGVLLAGYAILDGFDLGVGFWSLFTKDENERSVMMNSIGPVWDGNEVWLLTGGGALFAAFPHVYATVFSGFYLALMLVLYALIFRAVSFEFRASVESAASRRKWEAAFGYGSAVPALLFGVALGNVVRGLPLDAEMNFTGNFFTLLNPYALLIGLVGLAMMALHGALWLVLKAEGELEAKARRWAGGAWIAYLALFLAATAATAFMAPGRMANFMEHPVLWLIPVVALAAIVSVKPLLSSGRDAWAFTASCISIAGMWGIVGASIFPAMVPALHDVSRSLTIYNASSSQNTLTVMLVLALIGMPVVIGYTIWTYRLFKGKTAVGHY